MIAVCAHTYDCAHENWAHEQNKNIFAFNLHRYTDMELSKFTAAPSTVAYVRDLTVSIRTLL